MTDLGRYGPSKDFRLHTYRCKKHVVGLICARKETSSLCMSKNGLAEIPEQTKEERSSENPVILDVGCGATPKGDVNVDLWTGFTPHTMGKLIQREPKTS